MSQNGYLTLYKAIVVRSLRDYFDPRFKKEIQDWVVSMDGLFPECAEAMGMSCFVLREMMVDKLIQIDLHKKLYINKEARFSFKGIR
jgi:hypothetical protein